MAARSEEDLCCPVCCQLFKDPVLLSCSHSFCKDCVKNWWRKNLINACPVCNQVSEDEPRCNLSLKNVCDSFMKESDQRRPSGPESVCSQHSEKLKLFCLDHQQPVCVICRDSKTHSEHRFRPIDEAAKDVREELQESLKTFQEKLKLFEEVQGYFEKTAEHIKVQAQHTEKQIKERFEKLRQFLEEEEEVRLAALKEEEKQKSQMMKEKIEALNREIAALSDTIRTTEEELGAEDVSFLLNYRTAEERVQQHPLPDDPQVDSGSLIDMAKHLGNLTFNIWNKMKDMVSYTPVVLDQNSAHPELILSEDLTSVKCGCRQKLPENPERFDCFITVIGSEGFNSGIQSWNVEVGDNPAWAVGVIAESGQRKGDKLSEYWEVALNDGKYTTFSPTRNSTVLSVKMFKRIRVDLDWNGRKLSFSDPESNKCIHAFRHTFTDRLFPYISTGSAEPLTISPVELSVRTEQEGLK
ncbi:nuclear factor 7, ovary-like [Thalassophryne amazonica]|uniref:nuclear factor 7, ovary-like n=1 Tax=Thalassophryne amazonica TaxID=390379 RepID=UPI001470CEC7|nr:nuclear factor 7, ovary-like [Thalassophryne amazonica]XP_034027810.1 nuclear factor 7, ovary-like [Thalassophryne amazonica]